MRYCPRCGATTLAGDEFCPLCGLVRPERPPGVPWRRVAIVVLAAFIVIAGLILAADLRRSGAGRGPGPGDAYEILSGGLAGLRLVDTWEYADGLMEQLEGFDSRGNPVVAYRDASSGVVRGFMVSLPPADRVTLSQSEAGQIAEALAARAPFFHDPTLTLEEACLVDHGPGTERYYFFRWVSRDPRSGAVLLRDIQVAVHPQTGSIIFYLSRDGGRVTIPTEPAIGRERAAQLALEAAAGRLSRPQVVEQHLWVSVAHGDQRLLWLVVLEEQGSQELARRLYVEIDAQNGAVLEASP